MKVIQQRFLRFGTFLITFYSLYLFLCFSAIANLFDYHNDILIIGTILSIALLNFASMGVETYKSNIITRFILTICEISKWFFIMYGCLTLFLYIIKIFITIPNNILFLIYISIVPICGIYSYYNGQKIIITEYELFINNLNEEINIIHISDLHIGSIRNKKLLNDLSKKIKNLDIGDIGDIVVISGDLADGTSQIHEDSFLTLKDLNIPIVFTPGNHDYYPGLENVILACEKANIKVLLKEKLFFKGLNIYPLPVFPLTGKFENDLEYLQVNEIKSEEVNILINHYPFNWEYFREIGFDIQLSGHSHGGQFFPFNFLGKIAFPYLRGLFKHENSYLSVTDGVGTTQPPMRLGTKSEIVILKLKEIK